MNKIFGSTIVLWMLCLIYSPIAWADYTIGLVGIESNIQNVKGTNLNNYTNLADKQNPLEYAQDVFSDILTVELASFGLEALDMSSRATLARRDEMIFELNMGKPEKIIQNFTIHPNYLIYGYITNFTVTHRETMGTNNISVEVSLTTRVVDAENGEIVFVATGKGVSSTHDTSAAKGFQFGGEEISEGCWHEALEKSLLQIIGKIKDAI
ncbi:MAG: hypothetical protein IJT04_02445 [Bacteroidales bacterium]|nr:hypothetical protein [Bacteroidales bacterium]